MEAAQKINEIDGLELLVIGQPEHEAVQDKVKELSGNIKGIPDHTYDKRHLIFAGSDAILMPSRYEPCGLVQLEAMRFGAVPIVTQTGGLAETVRPFTEDGGYGIFIRELSVDGIVAALREAVELSKTEKWLQMRRNASVQDFTWDGLNSVDRYLQLYEQALEAKR